MFFTAEGTESAEVFIGKHKTRLIGFSITKCFLRVLSGLCGKKLLCVLRALCLLSTLKDKALPAQVVDDLLSRSLNTHFRGTQMDLR